MPQVSLLAGITADSGPDLRSSFPINLIPVPKDTGPSKGYLLVAPGLSQFSTTNADGTDRGAINWNGTCYRVMGEKLVSLNSAGGMTAIGGISGNTQASLDYSTTHLCTVSNKKAWLYDGTTLTQITDPDLGQVIDVVFVDGYFMFTDGTYLIVTELANPFSIDPLKYGSSEADPDPITGVLKYRGEVYALNRYTIEVFDNVGGSGFPFSRVPSGMIQKGCVGTHAKTLFADTFAWLGSARNEPCSVYMAAGGAAQKIATREVELRLKSYTEDELAAAVLEAKADEEHQHLILRLPRETLVYDLAGSLAAGQPVWFFLTSQAAGVGAWRARNHVWCYGKWIVGDSLDGRVGYVDDTVATQYGEVVGWQFDTMLLYNEARGAIVWGLELTGTTGRAPPDQDPTVFHSYTVDGVTWSTERPARMGTWGQTQQRVTWRRCGRMRNLRGERFRGASAARVAWMRLEAEFEALSA